MSTLSNRSLVLRDFDSKQSTVGSITFRHFTLSERILRAAKFFFLFLVLAFLSVFVPILHFVLVPAFSFAAVGSAMAYFVQTDEVEEASGICPYCKKTTKLSRAKSEGEFRDSCAECLQLIVVLS